MFEKIRSRLGFVASGMISDFYTANATHRSSIKYLTGLS